MRINSRHKVLKRMRAELPRGAPFHLAILAGHDVSAQLAAEYAQSGRLVRLTQGIYSFPNDDFNVYGALELLQKHVAGLRVGGKSALALQGVRHNLGRQDTLVLRGNARFTLPTWFTARFPARYTHTKLFDWSDSSLAKKILTTPPGLPEGLGVSVPERAVLELLYDPGTKESLEQARNLFNGLRPPRKELLGQLPSCCTSVTTVRLLLTWARETGIVDVDTLLTQNQVRTGRIKRWMSRLNDGT